MVWGPHSVLLLSLVKVKNLASFMWTILVMTQMQIAKSTIDFFPSKIRTNANSLLQYYSSSCYKINTLSCIFPIVKYRNSSLWQHFKSRRKSVTKFSPNCTLKLCLIILQEHFFFRRERQHMHTKRHVTHQLGKNFPCTNQGKERDSPLAWVG